MPLLDKTGYAADPWTVVEGAKTEGVAQALVEFADLATALSARKGNQTLGVIVPNNTLIEQITPHLNEVALIAIRFPGFADGRGFSIARSLRDRGFKGILRALGPLTVDQWDYAVACGFNEIDLPEASAERQSAAQFAKGLSAVSAHYQRSYTDYGREGSILDQRRASKAFSSEGGNGA